MPRMRTLHSEFFSDVICRLLDGWGRLFYQGSWCFADDCGRGRAIMRELAGFVFPHDEDLNVRPYYDQLVELGKIHHYEVGGQPYYHIPSWYKFQRPNRPTPSKLPRPTIDNCPGCHARLQAGDPFVDRFPLMWEARDVGLDPTDRKVWAAIVEDHILQLREGIAVPTVRSGTRQRQPILDLITGASEITDSLTDASVSSAGVSPRRNQEVGIRNQDVGSSNNDGADAPVADAVFSSMDDIPSHVPLSAAYDMLPGAPVDATGMPDGWLEGYAKLINRFLGYYVRGGAVLPAGKAAEVKQFLVNLGITATQAIALFDAYDEDRKRTKQPPPRAQSINFFVIPFQKLLAKQADSQSPDKQARKSRFDAYTKRSSANDPSDRQHA